jgi:hypothetical protein
MMIPARPVPDDCPFWERHVTLGRVKDGQVTFAQRKTDKREALKAALAEISEGAIFFLAWTGKWRTDLFAVTGDDLAKWYIHNV